MLKPNKHPTVDNCGTFIFLSQETTDRLMEAKQRVAHIKAKEATVQAFYPLPPNVVSGLEEAETRPLQGSL